MWQEDVLSPRKFSGDRWSQRRSEFIQEEQGKVAGSPITWDSYCRTAAGRLIGWMSDGEEEVTGIGQAFRRGNKRLRPSKVSGPACPLLLLGLTGHPVMYSLGTVPSHRCLRSDFALVLLCFIELRFYDINYLIILDLMMILYCIY
jgi:hypothetical protein